MELLCIVAIIFIFIFIKCYHLMNTPSEFDVKAKEIEDILNSSEARRRKYELFGSLDELTQNCKTYSDLDKLQKLLGRVYDL